jgi:hypothetical protein
MTVGNTGGGALDSSVTLDEVFTVVGSKRVPLAPELAGYLVLEVAEHADPAGGDIDPKSVFIGEEGSVALIKARREGAVEGTEASVRATLARLLEASGTQTPALAAAARRKSGAGLRALAEEIEAALIPVNRAAGRRALARLAREVKRVTLGVGRNALPSNADASPPSTRRTSSPSQAAIREAAPAPSNPGFSKEEEPTTTRSHIPEELLRKATPAEWSEMPTVQFEPPRGPSPSQADVDSLIDQFNVSGGGEQQHARDLKAMAGLEPTPPPPVQASSFGPRADASIGGAGRDSDVEALLAMGADPESRKPRPPAEAPASDGRQLPTQPSQLRRSHSPVPPPMPRQPRRGSTGAVLLALAAVGGGGYLVWHLRLFAPPERAAGPAPPSAQVPVAKAAPSCLGTLVVTDVPAHAEALLRAGQAPVDVEKMPVGARLEFVATAEGYSPRRVVVPAGAAWDTGPDGKPRFEAAAQLEKSRGKPGTNDPWPAGEPGSEVGGQGPPGTVRVVTTPRGAEVWMLAGIGPEVRIDQVPCEQDIDVLLAGPTTFRKRLHVKSTDFVRSDATPAGDRAGDPAGAAKAPARIARVSAK